MDYSKRLLRFTAILSVVLSIAVTCHDASAQIRIGGGNGVVIGGGQGVRIGGGNGVQFGGGAGAKFGGPSGVQFGGGRGAKFGGSDGVQFGGGAGAKFGPLRVGGQPDDATDKPVATPTDRPTTLFYPKDAKKPLEFTLNDHKFKVEPGQTVRLRSDRLWVIRFAATVDGRDRRYSLPPGNYTFNQTSAGWNLHRVRKPQPAAAPVPTLLDREHAGRRRLR